jgi:NitT/TauT family transport system substrate-binding protein
VADRLGALREEGLNVTITVPAPGGTVELLETGKADLILSGVMRSFIAAEREQKHLVAIAEVNSRDGFFIVSRVPGELRWQLLEGKRLAVFGLAPTPWMCLQTALREQGVDPARIEVVHGLDVAQGIEALKSGRVDFLQTGQPTAEELIADGIGRTALPQAPIVGHVPFSSFIVTEETRRTRPDFCGAALRALTRAFQYIARSDGATIAQLIAPEFPETPLPILERAVTQLKSLDIWSDGPRQDRTAFARLGRTLVAGGLIVNAAPYDRLVDDSFAEAAVTSLRA